MSKYKLSIFHSTQHWRRRRDIMAQAIGTIEPLKWSKTSKAADYSSWFKIFECMLVINQIDVAKPEQALLVKAILYAYGGEKIRLACDSKTGYAISNAKPKVSQEFISSRDILSNLPASLKEL